MSWDDDPYSTDLASQFHAAFHQPYLPPVIMEQRWSIPFSVGEFDRPNAVEAQTVDRLLEQLRSAPFERRVLVLPAGAAQSRRILQALAEALPNVRRKVVAVGGDSINVNTVYRDADIAWNIRAIKVPFVFFAHQNPVAWDRSDRRRRKAGRSRSSSSADRHRRRAASCVSGSPARRIGLRRPAGAGLDR